MTKINRAPGPNGGDSMTFASGSTLAVGADVAPRLQRKSVTIPTALVTATAATAILAQGPSFEHAVTIKRVAFLPNAASAGHATNNVTIALHNKGLTGTAAVPVASLTLTTGNALVANKPRTITLLSTGASVAALCGLVAHRTKNSSGITMPAGMFTVEYAVTPT